MAAACAERDGAQPVASVDGERITQADLERFAASRPQDAPDDSRALDPDMEQLQRLNLLRDLIDQRLLLQRADALGLTAGDDEVEAMLERLHRPHGTAEAFEEALHNSGMTLRELRTELRRQLRVQKLLNREISARVVVGEDEMREYYQKNRPAFTLPEQQVHLAQILVSEAEVSPIPNLRNDDATDPDSARRKIQRIHEELEDGADFEQLALHYSEDPVHASNGGDMGFIPQSVLEKADVRLRRALVSLQPGQFSPIVETDGEYRILFLIAIEPAGERSFDDPGVRKSIRDVLANRKEQLLRSAYYEIQRSRARIRNLLAERIAAAHGLGN